VKKSTVTADVSAERKSVNRVVSHITQKILKRLDHHEFRKVKLKALSLQLVYVAKATKSLM
jgi:hypothetical protein